MNPKQLSNLLFAELPKESHSISILDNENNQFETVELSELLVNILFYGLETMHDDLKSVDINSLSSDDFNAISPWFESMGYKVNSEQLDIKNYKNGNLHGLYYARIVLNQGKNKFYFKGNDPENFKFVFNGDIDLKNLPFHKLDEFNYLFLNNDKAIVLSFSKLNAE